MADELHLTEEQRRQMAQQAREFDRDNKLFSACYTAAKNGAQHMLDQLAAAGVPANHALMLVHIATVALGASFREMAHKHLGVAPPQLDAAEVNAKSIGAQIYEKQWAVLMKAAAGAKPAIVETDAAGVPKPPSGLIDVNGNKLR